MLINNNLFTSISNVLYYYINNNVYIFTTTISLISIIFIIYYLFKKNVIPPDYYNINYWERRYKAYPLAYDWYADTNKVFEDFDLNSLFNNKLKNNVIKLSKSNSKILELGCGSSTLSLYIASKFNYKQIYALDYSYTIINNMKLKYNQNNNNNNNNNIKFIQGDYNNLSKIFNHQDIHLIIEKAGLDTICTLNNIKDIQEKLFNVFKEMHSVLVNKGLIITISNKSLDFWNSNVYNRLKSERMFQLIDTKKSTSVINNNNNNNKVIMNYYYYLLIKV